MAFTAIAVLTYLGLVLVMSLVCFVAYGFDKQRAINGDRRVPESTLQLLAFLGGWPGAMLAQRYLPSQDTEDLVPDRVLVPRRAALCLRWRSCVCCHRIDPHGNHLTLPLAARKLRLLISWSYLKFCPFSEVST